MPKRGGLPDDSGRRNNDNPVYTEARASKEAAALKVRREKKKAVPAISDEPPPPPRRIEPNAEDPSVPCPIVFPSGEVCGNPSLVWKIRRGTPTCRPCDSRIRAEHATSVDEELARHKAGSAEWMRARMSNPEMMDPTYIVALSEWLFHYMALLATARHKDDFENAYDLHAVLTRHARILSDARRSHSAAHLVIQSFQPVLQFVARFVDDLINELPTEQRDGRRQAFVTQAEALLNDFEGLMHTAEGGDVDDEAVSRMLRATTARALRQQEKEATRGKRRAQEEDEP